MNITIKLFRSKINGRAPRLAPKTPVRTNQITQLRLDGRAYGRARNALCAIWHMNPATGRLECRWTSKRNIATDDGVSWCGCFRRAA